VASVDQILVASTPTFLESIRMSTFTLGSKAPRIDFIRSHPETENDVVVMVSGQRDSILPVYIIQF
jgi:Ca2+-dependent lipid-binding protein